MDHLQHIFESSRDALGVSLRGVHVLVNAAYVALFGYDRADELIGRPILDLIATSHRDHVVPRIHQRADGKPTPALYESRGLRRDGSEFDLEVYASSYVHDDAIHTLVTLRDITERNVAARALRESEEKFRLLTEQALLGIAILQGGRIRFANQRISEMLEHSIEEILAWERVDLHALFHPDDVATIASEVRRKLEEGGEHSHYTVRALSKVRGMKWIEVYSKRIDYGGAPAVLITQLDVTDRHEAEAGKEKLEDALRQAQKMEAVGQLAGGIAHDFNNLLTGIIGNVSLARRGASESSPAVPHLIEAQQIAERAAALTAQLLSFSRKQTIVPRPLDVSEMVARSERLLRRVIGEDITLITDLAGRLPLVQADAAQLEQVIVNLVVNVRDAAPGGTIRVTTAALQLDEAESRAAAVVGPGRYVRLSVEDDGCGMSEDVKRHIFEPFFTTKPTGKGTGLGLAMVFGAVTQNGATVDVRSAPGRGSRFDVWFPSTSSEAEAPGPDDEKMPPSVGAEIVLLVEDDASVRNLVERSLTELGYTVLACEDGPAALAAAAARKGRIDLLFTDVIMPGMNGREVADRLTALRPGLRVLFTSGYSGDAIGAHGVLGPSIHFLQKPYRPEELAAHVRRALDGST